MIKKWFSRGMDAMLISMVILAVFGAASEGWRQYQAQRPERPATNIHTGTQPALDPTCLIEGYGQPEGCRGGLPECLQEDGSGPGVWCFWTDPDTGAIWFNDGNEDD